jgi:hypothetical protein
MKIEKTYVWNRGTKRRPSEYEDVTAFYSTPAVPFLESQTSHPASSPLPWHYTKTRIGPPSLDGSTLQHEAWETFLDPAEMYYRTYVRQQWEKEQHVNAALRDAAMLPVDLPSSWVNFLRDFFPPLRYSKWARVQAMQFVIRFVPSSPVDAAVAFQAFDELRATQRIIRRTLDLADRFGGFDDHRRRWLDEPAWQPAREFAERLNATKDWGEVVVACNLCLEPLIEPLIEEVASMAAAVGDSGTAAMLASLLTDEVRHRRWSDAFVAMLTGSEAFGGSNREILAGWVAKWYPRAVAVIRGIGPMIDGVDPSRWSYAAFENDLLRVQYPALLERLEIPVKLGDAEAAA